MIEAVNQREGLEFNLNYDIPGSFLFFLSPPPFSLSDQASFFKMRKDKQRTSAVFFTSGLHPQYHKPSDQSKLVEAQYLARISKLGLYLAWEIANTDQPPDYLEKLPR